MKPSLDVYNKKRHEFDAISKNIVQLRDFINSDEYFKLAPEYRSALLSEYHTSSSLRIHLKIQIDHLRSVLYPSDVPNII
jgi:hypothetical protein